MRRAPWLVLGSVALVGLVAACGLSVGGLESGPGSVDASIDATDGAGGSVSGDDAATDAHHGGDATSHPDGASDDANYASDAADGGAGDGEVGDGALASDGPGGDGSCDGAAGCVIVPPGWSLVAFAPGQSPACPVGFQAPTDLVEGPDAGAACACGACSVTAQPSCASGSVGVYYDIVGTITGGRCGLPGTQGPLKNVPAGGCDGAGDAGDMYHGSYAGFDIEYVAPPPTGGTCSTPGVATTGTVTYAAHDRACAPISPQAAGCTGNACTPSLSGSYKACVMQAGTVNCPPGPLSVQHLVGSSATFACSDCGCAVNAACTGTVTLYTDSKCKTGALPVPADGACHNIASIATGSTNFNSYVYTGDPPSSVQCTPSGASSAQNVALASPATVCCAP